MFVHMKQTPQTSGFRDLLTEELFVPPTIYPASSFPSFASWPCFSLFIYSYLSHLIHYLPLIHIRHFPAYYFLDRNPPATSPASALRGALSGSDQLPQQFIKQESCRQTYTQHKQYFVIFLGVLKSAEPSLHPSPLGNN